MNIKEIKDRIFDLSRSTHNFSIIGGDTNFRTVVLESIVKDVDYDFLNLGLIDFSMIEEKGHLFLNLIARIDNLVQCRLDALGCDPISASFPNKREWQTLLHKLAHGLPIMYRYSEKEDHLQDAEFIMDKKLLNIKAANDLNSNFQVLVDFALKVLNKKYLFVAFEDLRFSPHLWITLMDVIRKYLRYNKIFTVSNVDLDILNVLLTKSNYIYSEDFIDSQLFNFHTKIYINGN